MRLPFTTDARIIWRAVRDAGDAGLGLPAICELMRMDPDSHKLRTRLVAMSAQRYITRIGTVRQPRWVMGLNVPDGERPEIGAPSSKAFAGLQPGRVVTSVWQLASIVGGQP